MRWGLLAGIGAGLSQGSQMVSQGMAEDRAVRRAEELERMREASFERRWKQQIQREDQLRGEDKAQRANERAEDKALRQQERKEEMGWRQSESNRQAGQFDRQMSQREKQVIEQNLAGVMEARREAEAEIVKRYQKMADVGGVTKEMQQQMEEEIRLLRESYDTRLQNMVSSYGDRLRGSGFEYLLDAPNLLPGEDANTNSDGAAEKEAAGNGRLDKLKGITSSWKSQGKTTMPLVEAADKRANALQQSNQRTMQALQRMGSGVNPSLAQQAQERINANNAELERIGLLRDEFMKAVPTTIPTPPNNDWRQDPEYLKRRNHFQ
jgi:hypothetical protein